MLGHGVLELGGVPAVAAIWRDLQRHGGALLGHLHHRQVALREEEAVAALHQHRVRQHQVVRDDKVDAVVPLAKDLVRALAVALGVHRDEHSVLRVLGGVALHVAHPVVLHDVRLQRRPRLAKVAAVHQVLVAQPVRSSAPSASRPAACAARSGAA